MTYMEIFSYTFDLTSKRGKSGVKERFPFWGLVTHTHEDNSIAEGCTFEVIGGNDSEQVQRQANMSSQ